MKTIDSPMETKDSVIEELHQHKRAIALEHGDDIQALLRDLQKRQSQDSRIVNAIKGKPIE